METYLNSNLDVTGFAGVETYEDYLESMYDLQDTTREVVNEYCNIEY